MRTPPVTRMLPLLALLPWSAACGDGTTGPGTSDAARVTLAVAVTAPGGSMRIGGDLAGFDVVLSDPDGQTITIESVEIVLREIELERAGNDDCDDHVSGADDDCEEFETGPVVLDLPLDGAMVEHAFEVTGVPPGDYDEVEFKIHKPEDDPGDQAFLDQHPDLRQVSVRATGQFDDGNGASGFVFVSNLSEEQEHPLAPPVTVGESGTANVTLLVDVSGWFAGPGGTLIDPATASTGGSNESIVEENIKNSLDAFEDDDLDGRDD